MKDSTSFFEKCLLWYFPLSMLYWFGLLVGIDTHLILPLQAFIALCPFVFINKLSRCKIRAVITFFILYSILSLFLVVFSNGPIDGYVNDVRIVILPMLAIYIGMNYEGDKIYRVFLYSVVICMLVGLYLFVSRPSWYVIRVTDYWSNQWYIARDVSEESILSGSFSWASRFGSIYITAYGVSYFATFALCLLVVDLYRNEKYRLVKKRWMQILFLIILSVSIILSQTRIAMFYLVLLLFVGLWYGMKNRKPQKKYFIYSIAILALIFVYSLINYSHDSVVSMFITTIQDRYEDFQANGLHNSSRSYQITKTLSSWNNYIVGDGLGTRGGIARQHGLPGVTDNGYIKLLVEQGILGLFLLLYIFISSMRHAYKNIKVYLAELLILGYVLVAMTGANPLGMEFDYMIIMWFSLGHIWNKSYINDCIKTKNFI